MQMEFNSALKWLSKKTQHYFIEIVLGPPSVLQNDFTAVGLGLLSVKN
jgi:hypothetical protein